MQLDQPASASFAFRMTLGVADHTDSPVTRREVERKLDELSGQVEMLVAFLDHFEDPDAEEDGSSEPSLGWTKTMAIGDRNELEEAYHAV